MEEQVSNEEFAQWRRDPVSEKIIARIDRILDELKHQWYTGVFGDTEKNEAYWRGFAVGIHEFLRTTQEEGELE